MAKTKRKLTKREQARRARTVANLERVFPLIRDIVNCLSNCAGDGLTGEVVIPFSQGEIADAITAVHHYSDGDEDHSLVCLSPNYNPKLQPWWENVLDAIQHRLPEGYKNDMDYFMRHRAGGE